MKSGDKVTVIIANMIPKQLVSILKKKGSTSNHDPVNGNTCELLSSSQNQAQMSQSVHSSFNNKANKAPPPAPPKRDPSTTLSTSRARARSLVVSSEVRSAHTQTIKLMADSKGSNAFSHETNLENEDERKCSSPSSVESLEKTQGPNSTLNGNKVASIRSHSSRRISSYELNEFMSRQNDNAKVCII